jgi:hypothetical protein
MVMTQNPVVVPTVQPPKLRLICIVLVLADDSWSPQIHLLVRTCVARKDPVLWCFDNSEGLN